MNTHLKRSAAAVALTAALIASANPAFALTKSGSQSCGSGARVGVVGQQQTLAVLTLKVGGLTLYQSASNYTAKAVSTSVQSGTWSAASNSLLLSGTYPFCQGTL